MKCGFVEAWSGTSQFKDQNIREMQKKESAAQGRGTKSAPGPSPPPPTNHPPSTVYLTSASCGRSHSHTAQHKLLRILRCYNSQTLGTQRGSTPYLLIHLSVVHAAHAMSRDPANTQSPTQSPSAVSQKVENKRDFVFLFSIKYEKKGVNVT